MPYFWTSDHPDCEGFAVVKEEGELVFCHRTRQEAIDHHIAISLAEDLEPGGEYEGDTFRALRAEPDELEVGDFVRWESSGGTAQGRIERIERDGQINVPDSEFVINGEPDDPAALIRIFQEGEEGWGPTSTLVAHRFSTLTKIDELRSEVRELPDAYRPANSDDVPEGRACGNCFFYQEDKKNEDGLSYCSKWDDYVRGDYYCNAWESNDSYRNESRDVDLTPPAYMRAAFRKGIELYEEGLAGDGVTEQTIREARAGANGSVTADKWARIGPWIARHLTDLEAESNQPDGEGFPGPGAVAFYLWGATPTRRGATRTQEYAENITRMVMEENEGRVKGEALTKMETRTFTTDFEVREEADGMTFTGYAALFNEPSHPLPFIERIAPGAFKRSLKSRNNIFLFNNHNSDQILASTRSGTLRLSEDGRGLRVEATIANTSVGRDVAELVRTGIVGGMSFGFSVPSGGDEWNKEGTERTLKSVRLMEVSVTAMPAYESTNGTATVRGLDKLALRSGVDADALADALVKLETGAEISDEDKNLLSTVIDTLSPKSEDEPEETPSEPTEDESKAKLELKKKKLAALMKEIV